MATVDSVMRSTKNRPENISPKIICMWLSKLDEKLSQELMYNNEFIPYQFPEDAKKELVVKSPHDNIYELYIYAMIDFFYGELAEYSSSAVLFEEAYAKYKKTFRTKERN